PAKPEQAPQASYYPRPGKANVAVRVGIVPISGGPTVWIDWDHKKYEYLAQVRWDSAGPLTIQVQNRLQNELALLKVDPKTGKTEALPIEKDPTWVNLHQEVPRWTADGKQYLWVSDRAGAPQLELRGLDGSTKVLVEPKAGYQALVSFNPKTQLA